jgi:hypothetical protein
MGSIYIFNKLPWKAPIVSKLLTAPTLELNLSYADDDIVPMPGKQRAVFDSKFKTNFDFEFDKRSKAWMKSIQDAVTDTEARLAGKSKKEMEEAVATANQLLKQAFTVWQNEMAKLCEDCVTQAYDASVAKMERKLLKARIKAVCTIVLIAGLVLTAAALTIAATVASGGALAPLVMGAIVTGAGALYKAYKVYDTHWANSENKIKEIKADIQKLKDAIGTYKKTETSYSGLADKAKALKTILSMPVNDIDRHVGQLDKFIFQLQESIKTQREKLTDLAVQAKDAKAGELDAAVKTCLAKMDKARDQLAAIKECQTAAAEMKAAYKAQKVPDYGKLNSLIGKLSDAKQVVTEASGALNDCFTALKLLGVSVPV